MHADHHRIGTPEEILEMALRKEQDLCAFYGCEAERHRGPDIVQSLLTELEEDEQRHVRMIEKMLLRFRLG